MQERVRRNTSPVRRVADLPASASPAEAMDSLQAAVAHEHSSDLALDSGMREKFADHFGPVASKVRFVESDLPGQLGAKALAQGDTIRVAPGAYTPGTESGEKLLAHELGHVVQQSRGEALDGAGMPLMDSSVEHGADAIADSAMSGSLNVSATPAPAASAPMLGLGIFSRLKGWFSRKAMNDEEKKKVKEQVALRPWKMTAEQLKHNKYNPGGSESVAMDDWRLNSGWVEGADNEYNLRTIEENFGTLLDSGKAKGQLDKRMSANGVRERMLNMARVLNDFPELRKFLKGNDNNADKGAVMSVTPTAEGEKAGILHWNPQQVVNKKGYAEPAAGETEEEKKQREAENKTWMYDQFGLANGHSAADDSYTGVHELGHMLNIMLWKQKSPFFYEDDRDEGETNNKLINKSLRHLARREEKKNLPEAERKFTKFLNERKGYNYRTKSSGKELNFGRSSESRFYTKAEKEEKKEKNTDLYRNNPEVKAAYRESHGLVPAQAPAAPADAAQAPAAPAPVTPAPADAVQAPAAPAPAAPAPADAAQTPAPAPVDDKFYQPEGEGAKYYKNGVKLLFEGKKVQVRSTGEQKILNEIYQPMDNRRELNKMGQTSGYGSKNVNEMIAEAYADVYAHGKDATKLNKQLVKRMWRQLNPDAAYEEYRQKQADYASGKRRKPGT